MTNEEILRMTKEKSKSLNIPWRRIELMQKYLLGEITKEHCERFAECKIEKSNDHTSLSRRVKNTVFIYK